MATTEEREEADKVEQRAAHETPRLSPDLGRRINRFTAGLDCTTMIWTHVVSRGPAGVRSPADRVLDP